MEKILTKKVISSYLSRSTQLILRDFFSDLEDKKIVEESEIVELDELIQLSESSSEGFARGGYAPQIFLLEGSSKMAVFHFNSGTESILLYDLTTEDEFIGEVKNKEDVNSWFQKFSFEWK